MGMKINDIVERNISLTGEIMRYLLDNPQVFASLPDNFELVILPENDPEGITVVKRGVHAHFLISSKVALECLPLRFGGSQRGGGILK